jgi:nucleotide-binding universal stress UspA family protein
MVLTAGVPVMFAPDDRDAFRGDRIVVGWKNTRETRRSLADALPFMKRASAVFIVAVAGADETEARRVELDEVVRRLTAHGVEAQPELVAKEGLGTAEDLERAAANHRADLIVVGAYGHSRAREWALGGMTQDLLASSSKFVLFSH